MQDGHLCQALTKAQIPGTRSNATRAAGARRYAGRARGAAACDSVAPIIPAKFCVSAPFMFFHAADPCLRIGHGFIFIPFGVHHAAAFLPRISATVTPMEDGFGATLMPAS